jgi:hypothetical protein
MSKTVSYSNTTFEKFSARHNDIRYTRWRCVKATSTAFVVFWLGGFFCFSFRSAPINDFFLYKRTSLLLQSQRILLQYRKMHASVECSAIAEHSTKGHHSFCSSRHRKFSSPTAQSCCFCRSSLLWNRFYAFGVLCTFKMSIFFSQNCFPMGIQMHLQFIRVSHGSAENASPRLSIFLSIPIYVMGTCVFVRYT